MADELDVSVVLPFYNEVGHLADEIRRIRESLEDSSYSYEIIAIDDGSTDGSDGELEQFDDLVVIAFSVNRGTGTVRKAGTRAARGRVVVWTDADMSYPNDKIPWLVDQLEGYDQVVGARTSEAGSNKWARGPAKALMRWLAGYLTETKIPDLNSGLRAFRRTVGLQYLHLLPAGFSCVTTMTMTFLANGYSVKYVPIDYFPRAGVSKFRWWKDSRSYLHQIIRLVMRYAPLRIFFPAGLALLLAGTTKLGLDMYFHPFRVATSTLLLFFAALQVLAVGLLADLMVDLSKRQDIEVESASK